MDTVADEQKLRKVYLITKFTYGIVPLVAGIDKFTHLLTHWEKYLHPMVPELLSIKGHTFMLIVGVIEIIAGIIVFVRPVIGAYIVMFWLIGISINLIMTGEYLDIAVRDLVIAVGAYAFAQQASLARGTGPMA